MVSRSLITRKESNAEKIGDRIRKYREEKGYTRLQFAELIDRSYDILRRYEHGTVRPSPFTLMKMAIVLDISVLDILRD